ncbi:MAG TPA: ABC transporter substrate-binding protein [Stellaceae bacterium]|nr:ABC transporter substrate-binding protein [Stellaceae bacterium]
MRRRRCIAGGIATLVAAAAPWWLTAGAKEGQRSVPLVGAIWPGGPTSQTIVRNREFFLRGLRENGYVDGQNILIADRYEGSPEGFDKAAIELVGLNVDVILASSTPAALAARRATSAIPIVGAVMADPVADGLVASLARPGGNITGDTFIAPELSAKRLQLLREIVPSVTRIAALQHPGVYGERTMQNMLKEIEENIRESGLELRIYSADGPSDFDSVFEAMIRERAGALIIFPSPMFYRNYRRLVELTAIKRLPTMYVFREAVEVGGLICYGADIPDLSRLAATYVAKILRGAKPSDLPVEQPTKFELAVNLKTAKVLGLTIPPSILALADEVIE